MGCDLFMEKEAKIKGSEWQWTSSILLKLLEVSDELWKKKVKVER